MLCGLVERARNLAEKWHSHQLDKAGNPYIHHLEYVSSMVDTKEAKAVAYLHDILEDTACTVEELRTAGFNQEIVDAVISITHLPDESYGEFINRVSKNRIATLVKIEDLKHNSDLSRLGVVTQHDLERREKYEHYLEILIALSK